MNLRIGHGYDVHRMKAGRKCVLGGVNIPYERGPLGHSDADVLLHAVMDAVLGALAEGDIGKMFPDSDPAYSGIDSRLLLDRVIHLMEEKNYRLSNLDVTVIAQKPKLTPYIPAMRQNLADAFRTSLSAVNVKATTEEGLGFTGREEGLAVHAVCLLMAVT